MPRETRLTPEIQRKIVAAIKQGSYFSVACESVGVPEATGREWLDRGRGTDGCRDNRQPFADFADAIKKAESEAEKAAIARIQKAAQGRKYKTTKKKEVLTKEGLVETLEEVTEGTEYSWQADAWYLERKFGERWSAKRIDILEALRVLADAKMIPEQIPEMALHEMGRVREVIREAFSGISIEPPQTET